MAANTINTKIPAIVAGDPMLKPYADVILHRMRQIEMRYGELTGSSGKLSDVMLNHLYFGLHRSEDNGWVIREWAPNAHAIYLIGDFNGWQVSEKYKMALIGGGRFELRLPPDTLRHGMLYKFLVQWNGGSGERIPAHCRRVTQDSGTGIFAAQVWEPAKPYIWKHAAPPAPKTMLIYEAHIGMAAQEYGVGTYSGFRRYVLPRIATLGYNTLQLMAIAEHPYYGSFGYQVSNFYAPSSRFGSPDELKELIDEAHGLGLSVIMDIVHSHAVKNEAEGLGRFDGTRYQFFHSGSKGEHPVWDSLCFDYGKNEVLAFLLSNCHYWLAEYRFDGFRFDGVTSMLYAHHGAGKAFTDYSMYFNGEQDEDAVIYLALANKLVHEVKADAITIAEDVSGMPGLAERLEDGGIGFDYRMSMGIADYWIRNLKTLPDEQWHVGDMYFALTDRRSGEHTVSYAECHDQAMVGDKTIIFWLLDKEMYTGMSALYPATPVIDRGIALHKMIRLATFSTSDGGYLTFMGNEWGHPEWIDFPREGNGWSYQYARRQWNLLDNGDLRYKGLWEWDRAMVALSRIAPLFDSRPYAIVQHTADHVLIFKRGDMIFAFNFDPARSFSGYGFEADRGSYRLLLSSDDAKFGGMGRITEGKMPYSTAESGGKHFLRLYLPCRTAQVLIHSK